MLLMVTILIPSAFGSEQRDLRSLVFAQPAFDFSFAPGNESRDPLHIPIILNDRVEAYIDYFTSDRITFQNGLDNSMPYMSIMKGIFRDANLPEELVYVAMIESWFDSAAVSKSRAVGLWQFMSGTAREYGLRTDRWIDERKDGIKATFAAARYFRHLHSRLRSWNLVLAAYNAGIGRVLEAVFGAESEDFWDLAQSNYLSLETKSFVPKFMAAAIIARDPAAYGFRPPSPRQIRFDFIELQRSTDLQRLAQKMGSTYAELKQLNPEILGKSTPPGSYLLKVPKGALRVMGVKTVLAADPLALDAPALVPASAPPGTRTERSGSHDTPFSPRGRVSVIIAKQRKQRADGKSTVARNPHVMNVSRLPSDGMFPTKDT